MAGSLNKVMIIGNLGRDPELRYTQRGTPVCNFTVAVNRPGRVDDATGQRAEDETEWFAVVAWDKLAETCSQYLAKGRKVYIEGRLQTRSWEGQDGQKRSRVEVLAQQMVMLDPRQQGGEEMALAGAGARRDVPARPPRLYVLVGLPGSGKSTYARRELPGVARISLDDLRMMMSGVAYDARYEPLVAEAAAAALEALLRRAREWGCDLVFD